MHPCIAIHTPPYIHIMHICVDVSRKTGHYLPPKNLPNTPFLSFLVYFSYSATTADRQAEREKEREEGREGDSERAEDR